MQVSSILALPDITVPSWRSGHAAACRAAILPFKSGTWLRGLCGHSREVPPGPIPNPAVKLSCVDYCTQIREFSGTSQRCNPLPFVETYSYCNLNTKAKALCFLKSLNLKDYFTESILPHSETIFILASNSILYHNGISRFAAFSCEENDHNGKPSFPAHPNDKDEEISAIRMVKSEIMEMC